MFYGWQGSSYLGLLEHFVMGGEYERSRPNYAELETAQVKENLKESKHWRVL
jgi:hypothetical protein